MCKPISFLTIQKMKNCYDIGTNLQKKKKDIAAAQRGMSGSGVEKTTVMGSSMLEHCVENRRNPITQPHKQRENRLVQERGSVIPQ